MPPLPQSDNPRSYNEPARDKLPNPPETPKQPTVAETISRSIQGQDEPLEKKAPEFPAALVFWSYPVMLLVLIAIAAFVAYLFGFTEPASTPTPQ